MSRGQISDVLCACRVLIRALERCSAMPSQDLAVVARYLGATESAVTFSSRRRSGYFLDPSRSREDTIRRLADLQEDLELELAAQRRHGVKPQPRRAATSEQGKERR